MLGTELGDKVYDQEQTSAWCVTHPPRGLGSGRFCGSPCVRGRACDLTEKIKAKVKENTSERYKLAVQVHIGAMEVSNAVALAVGGADARAGSAGAQGQGIFAASRCLWDEKTDNYVSASYYNNSLFAVATVFACYYE